MGHLENLYKAANQKAKVNNQAVGGQDQFGATHGALKKSPPHSHQANGMLRSADELREYFDSLAETVTTWKGLLEELVKANSTLTATNAELLATVTVLIKANVKLSCQVGNCCNKTHPRRFSCALLQDNVSPLQA